MNTDEHRWLRLGDRTAEVLTAAPWGNHAGPSPEGEGRVLPRARSPFDSLRPSTSLGAGFAQGYVAPLPVGSVRPFEPFR